MRAVTKDIGPILIIAGIFIVAMTFAVISDANEEEKHKMRCAKAKEIGIALQECHSEENL